MLINLSAIIIFKRIVSLCVLAMLLQPVFASGVLCKRAKTFTGRSGADIVRIMQSSPNEKLFSLFYGGDERDRRLIFARLFRTVSTLVPPLERRKLQLNDSLRVLGLLPPPRIDEFSSASAILKGANGQIFLGIISSIDASKSFRTTGVDGVQLSNLNYGTWLLLRQKEEAKVKSARGVPPYQPILEVREISFVPSFRDNWSNPIRVEETINPLVRTVSVSIDGMREARKTEASELLRLICSREGDIFSARPRDPLVQKYLRQYSVSSRESQ